MKTKKSMMLFTAFMLFASFSFAQINLGTSNSMQTSVTKSLNINAGSRVASNTLSRGTSAFKTTRSAAKSNAAELKSTATSSTGKVINKSSEKVIEMNDDIKDKSHVSAKANTRIGVKSSEQAKTNADENSVGLASGAIVQSEANSELQISKTAVTEETADVSKKVFGKVDEKKDASIDKARRAKAKTETRIDDVKGEEEKIRDTKIESKTEVKSETKANTSKS